MVSKEQIILNHYKKLIEERLFDEYDILGFLIFIRPKCGNYSVIKEFCDLIAHRERNRGKIMECITAAIKNNYETRDNSNEVKGYNGIKWCEWRKVWDMIGNDLSITFSDEVLREITLCIFSLLQDTVYCSNGYSGTIKLFQSSSGQISICTTEGLPHSLFVCFMVLEGITGHNQQLAGVISETVETCRIDGMLRLKTSTGAFII